jgi:hypothetical protein
VVRDRRRSSVFVAIAILVVASGVLLAQGALVQLGLTEAAARKFLLDELKSPASSRRNDIVVTGNRAFLKLPPAVRGQAAASLLAWAKAYVNSPAFKTIYANYRRGVIGEPMQYPLTVDEEIKKKLDDQLTGVEQLRKVADTFPPAERAQALETVKQQEAWARDPATFKMLKTAMEAERAEKIGREAEHVKQAEEMLPADSQKLFARRLRAFLEGTADVNFSARTIRLTGGPDGIEFVDPADRKHSWLWQEAVIVGQEATSAARAAAEAWLKEIER